MTCTYCGGYGWLPAPGSHRLDDEREACPTCTLDPEDEPAVADALTTLQRLAPTTLSVEARNFLSRPNQE